MAEPALAASRARAPERDGEQRDRHVSATSERRNYAALDLGTNNCRLLVARPSSDGFVVIDAFSRIVRLGEGLAASGRLSQAAMDRAVAALAVCADKLRRRPVSLVRSVATEACRRAANGREFVERVRQETGIVLDIISPMEEARLAVLGCQALIEPGAGPVLVFDIGGGSTELALLEPRGEALEIAAWYSAPWGVVSLSEAEPDPGTTPADRLAGFARMRDRVAASFAPFAATLPNTAEHPRRLLGTSGTVTTLASVHLGLSCYDRRAVDGLRVPVAAMRRISAQLAPLSISDRAKLPCIGPERADLVIAGCAILEAITDIWPAERLTVADRGIREGILRSLMGQDRAATPRREQERRR
jgi:exopolyphosphatase / guanosine-5'-triphosphate,3'-diphosphate pyrophosphatase